MPSTVGLDALSMSANTTWVMGSTEMSYPSISQYGSGKLPFFAPG
ncbi:MAG: hypothetical protein WBJ84_01300 [Bacteroidales bacterium]